MPSRRDRGLTVAVATSLLLGLACVAIGIWGLTDHVDHTGVLGLRGGPIGGLLAGPIFLGFGVHELVHRLRRGPQPPGRHSRAED